VVEGGKGFLTSAKIPFVIFEAGRMNSQTRDRMLSFFEGLGYVANSWRFSEERDVDADEENIYLRLREGGRSEGDGLF
jgi:hypothetical protein